VAKIKFGEYRGLYLVGDKATGRITDVQTVTPDGDSVPLPLLVYVARRIEPNYKTLPWREDIKIRREPPKSN
jgi:hypothetical protein